MVLLGLIIFLAKPAVDLQHRFRRENPCLGGPGEGRRSAGLSIQGNAHFAPPYLIRWFRFQIANVSYWPLPNCFSAVEARTWREWAFTGLTACSVVVACPVSGDWRWSSSFLSSQREYIRRFLFCCSAHSGSVSGGLLFRLCILDYVIFWVRERKYFVVHLFVFLLHNFR